MPQQELTKALTRILPFRFYGRPPISAGRDRSAEGVDFSGDWEIPARVAKDLPNDLIVVGECCDIDEEEIGHAKSVLRRSGSDITLVAYGDSVEASIQAAVELKKHCISAEVLELNTLKPLDEAAILRSARKTGRIVIAHEASRRCSVGAEVAALVAEKAISSLREPVVRLTGPDTPHVDQYQENLLPQAERIVATARRLVGEVFMPERFWADA